MLTRIQQSEALVRTDFHCHSGPECCENNLRSTRAEAEIGGDRSPCPPMHVKHLEIDSLASYLRKMRTYGRSSRLYRPIAHTWSLNDAERLGFLRRVFREQCLPLADRTILFSTLVTGLLSWSFGSLSARWARDDRDQYACLGSKRRRSPSSRALESGSRTFG